MMLTFTLSPVIYLELIFLCAEKGKGQGLFFLHGHQVAIAPIIKKTYPTRLLW